MVILQATDIVLNELLVTIVTTLFILSLISERLGNLIKLYWQSAYEEDEPRTPRSSLKTASVSETQIPKHLRPTRAGKLFGNLRYKQTDPALEKEREKGVQTVAVICGILVSIFSGADLFHLIETGKTLNWQDWFAAKHKLSDLFQIFCKPKMFSHAMGVIFAGLFVSLGSKFWHDILDFILYSSNLKQKLADPRTFQSSRIEEVDEWLAMYPGDLGRRAYDQYAASLLKNEKVAYISQTSENYNGVYQDVIRVYLKDSDDSRFRSTRTLPIKLESNRIVDVPLIVVTGVGDVPAVHGAALKGVSVNKKGIGYAGTACCILEDEGHKKYLLTCNHVLTAGRFKDLSDAELEANIKVELISGSKKIGGIWFESIQNEFYDIALIASDSHDLELIFKNGINLAPKAREMSKQDAGTIVKVLRRMKSDGGIDPSSNPQKARIKDYHINESIPLDYVDNQVQFKGLLELENIAGDGPVSVKGDSGALVYDDNDKAIGMIIAGNARFSYAIPMTEILAKTSTNIFTNEIV